MAATANQEFKSRYRKTLDTALILALLLMAGVFLAVPRPAPGRSPDAREDLTVVDLEREIAVPAPPRVIEPPRIPVESLDEEVAEEPVIGDTDFDAADRLVAPPPPAATGDFYAFDRMPRPLRRVSPEYPRMAREAGIEGIVTLRVAIDEHGRVVGVSVLHSDSELLDRAALEAMRRWVFVPAEQSGSPVRATVSIPLGFVLEP